LKFRTSNTLIKYLGVGFIILGFIRIIVPYNFDSNSLLAFTLTAFLLILSDLTQFISENYDNLEKSQTKNPKKDKIIIFLISIVHTLLVALSAISLIVIPYLDLSTSFSTKELTAINDMLTLSSLGIAISLIGLKSQRMQDKEIKEIIDGVANEMSKDLINSSEIQDLIQDVVDSEIKKTNIEDVVNKIIRNIHKESR
jgi:hypothetical protein